MPDKKKSARRLAREKAFQILYGLDFTGAADEAALGRAFAEYPRPEKQDKLDDKAETFSWAIVRGTWQSRAELDEIIGRFSQHWKVARIAKVDLTILRLGMYELLHRPDIPLKVAINEAVELAKEFGDENSRNFVNGILDAAARAVDSGELSARAGEPEPDPGQIPGKPSDAQARSLAERRGPAKGGSAKGDFEAVKKALVKALWQMPAQETSSAYRINMGILAYLGEPMAQAYLKQEGLGSPTRLDRDTLNTSLKLAEGRLEGHLGTGPSAINGYLAANHGLRLRIGESKASVIDPDGREWTL